MADLSGTPMLNHELDGKASLKVRLSGAYVQSTDEWYSIMQLQHLGIAFARPVKHLVIKGEVHMPPIQGFLQLLLSSGSRRRRLPSHQP